MCVTLTPAAAVFMKRMVRFGQGGSDAGFRLVVKAGGCSGFDSSFSVEAEPQPGDAVIEQEGVRLFLAEASCELLRGYTVDFKESRLDSGFAFSKPGAPHVCGCGAGEPGAKSSVVFMRPSIGCVKKPAV
jgi:iron-sulfur cluster assembly accessory protein